MFLSFIQRYLRYLTLLLLALITCNAAAVKLYKWTDADGKVSYQDQPPTTGQQFEEKQFTGQGVKLPTNPDVSRKQAARDNPVTLYLARQCDSCDLIRTVLDMNKIPYQAQDVENNQSSQQELIAKVGSVRVPTLLIGDQVVHGFDRNAIEDALSDNGYPIETNEIQ